MPGESFFMAFGGLGLSLAGFAGLISALNPHPSNAVIAAYRIRTIVFLGFTLTFAGFGTVALYSVTSGDLAATVRLGTLLMAISFLRGLLIDTRPGPAWPNEGERRLGFAILLLMMAITLGNLAVASVGYLQAVLLLGLIGPVTIFYNTIRDAGLSSVAAESASVAPAGSAVPGDAAAGAATDVRVRPEA
jgi:hypothetical protein